MREAFALQKLLPFFQQKYCHNWNIIIGNFNVSLTNGVVSFGQPGPAIQLTEFGNENKKVSVLI